MVITIGSEGDEVKKIQEKLGLKIDGSFGPKTEMAVKGFQTKAGINPDGIVGDSTWEKMFPDEMSHISDVGELKLSKLKGHIPDYVIEQITDSINKFNINTPLRLSHFLSQCAHESGNFTITEEKLNYSKERLDEIFKKYFPNNLSESYARKPEKIASRVYGGRMGNGPESTGDGYKFRGRGFIQLTGKGNYVTFGGLINEDLVSNPDLVATKYPLLSAAWFFNKNCLNRCDAGSSIQVIKSVSKCVNGGLNGLAERIEYFNKFYNLLK